MYIEADHFECRNYR